MSGRGSRDLEDEEGEELGADEEEEPMSDSLLKPDAGPLLSGSLDEDVLQGDMDYDQAADLELENSKSSPRR